MVWGVTTTQPHGGAGRMWWGAVLECPDPPALAAFYVRLLGWQAGKLADDWSTVWPGTGVSYLGFQRSEGYVPPVWPPREGEQRMTMHLDVEVQDVEAAVAHAVAAGATVADFQPQQDVRVMLDPAGHPFCLYLTSD